MRKIDLAAAFTKLIPLVILATVAGCGGGGGGSTPVTTPPVNTTPVDTTPPVSAPSISVQPVSISTPDGGSVTFSVTATGTAPLSYQWQRNGSDVTGATSAQYTLAQAQASDNGTLWTVVVRNSAASVTSAAAKLSVASKSLVAGAIAGNTFTGTVEIKGIAVDDDGNIYLSDRMDNGHLRVVTQQGVSRKLTLTANAGDVMAPLSAVVSLARDGAGNFYTTDQSCTIHKISPAGLLTTHAGGYCGAADGKGTAATFDSTLALTVDAGGTVYVAGGGSIRKIAADGTVTTLAGMARVYGTSDGDARSARFGSVSGIAVDAAGAVYVADAGSNIDGIVGSRIRKLSLAGIVSTVAGGSAYGAVDGAGAVATFSTLNGLTIDKQGNLFVADVGNHTIRKITPAGIVSTLAGAASPLAPAVLDGIGAAARFNLPYGVAADSAGNVYVADVNPGLQLNAVRKITPSAEVTTITGNNAGNGVTDGPAAAARFDWPGAIAVHSDGTVFVADTGNQLIRKISAEGVVSTLAGNPFNAELDSSGDGTGAQANFSEPAGIVVGKDGVAYVADAFRNTIRRVGSDGVVTTLAGSYQTSMEAADGQGARARFSRTNGIALDSNGILYVVDNHAVRKVDTNGNVTTLTGTLGPLNSGTADGTLAQARFGYPRAITIDASGNLYLTDQLNHNVRKITPAGIVTTLAGTTGVAGDADGPASAASFNGPRGIAVDKAGNVYVADSGNNLVRKISTSGEVTTVAGKRGLAGNVLGAFAGALNQPIGLAFDVNGNLLVTSANGIFKLPL